MTYNGKRLKKKLFSKEFLIIENNLKTVKGQSYSIPRMYKRMFVEIVNKKGNLLQKEQGIQTGNCQKGHCTEDTQPRS